MNLLEKITDKIAFKFSGVNRAKKFELFKKQVKPTKKNTILDVGFDDEEYSETNNYLEKHYPWPEKITALSDQKPVKFKQRYPHVKALTYDGTTFPFTNKKFDIGWSNAVIEHVGDYDSQLLFLKEITRTCHEVFLSTPNRWFPIEVHTRIPLLHYLPKKYFDKFLNLVGLKWASGDYVYLLSCKKIKKLLNDAKIKTYTIHKNKFLGFNMDFVIHFKSSS
jgi:SAM-dependent methyltransferase